MNVSVTNRKAFFDFEVLKKFEAGIELLGLEVPSVRKGQVSLQGAHVTVRGGEAFLIDATIAPVQPKNAPADYDEKRNRKLLLTQKEIAELAQAEAQKGLTIVPLSMYNKSRKIKLELAIVRGKKKFDKRETIKSRDTERDIQRTLKNE